MEEKKKELSKTLKHFYGVGDLGFNLMSNVETYYFNFFLTNVAAFSAGVAGLIASVASLTDACLSWIYGAILNTIKPKKWGRYRSWLIMVPWVVPILYAFQFLKIGNGVVSAVIITIAAIASHVCWNFPYVANVSMINVASSNPDDKIALSSSRASWNNLASVLFSYMGLPLATILGGIVGEQNQYAALAFVLGCIMVAGYYAHFKMFEGYEEIEVASTSSKANVNKVSAGEMVKSLISNPPLLALLIADLAKWMMKFVVAGTAIYYFTYVAQNVGMLATYILVSNIAGIIGAYISKIIAKKLSTRNTTIITFIIMAAAMIVAFFGKENAILVLILMSAAQLGYGVTYACLPALYADAVVYSEWKTKKNATGFIMGLQNIPLKVAVLTKAVVIAACLAAANFSADIKAEAATAALKNGIGVSFMVVPAITLIIGAVLLILGFRLTKEKLAKYQREIDERKANA